MNDPAPPTDLAEVRHALARTRFSDVRWVAETGSTNADVLELARRGEPEGIVAVADHQTAGRGRRGRTWEAPPDASLMCTVLLRPPPAVAGLTTMALALAAAEATESLAGVRPRLKWPNDLVWPGDGSAEDRKLAGILAEADWPSPSSMVVAAGIGLNVAWAGRMPAELADVAVALDEIAGAEATPGRADLLVSMLGRLDHHYGRLVSGAEGAAAVRADWEARSATIGRRVRVDLATEVVEGTAVGVTDEGHLIVETPDGGRRILSVGDVVHLRLPGRG